MNKPHQPKVTQLRPKATQLQSKAIPHQLLKSTLKSLKSFMNRYLLLL